MLYLWGRNIRGDLTSGWVHGGSENYAAPIAWLVRLLFLPLTLTLGAGIKTLIDIFSRKELPQAEMAKMWNELNEIDNISDRMDTIVEALLHYDPKSKSSVALCNKLRDLSNNAHESMEKDLKNEEWRLKKAQLNSEELEVLQKHNTLNKAIPNSTLNAENIEAMKKYRQTAYVKAYQDIHKKEKEAIMDYLREDKNSGKKSEHIIYNALFPPVTSEKQKPVDIIKEDYNKNPFL